jgi:hypothetical protein
MLVLVVVVVDATVAVVVPAQPHVPELVLVVVARATSLVQVLVQYQETALHQVTILIVIVTVLAMLAMVVRFARSAQLELMDLFL